MPLTDNLLRRLTSRTMGAIAFTCLLSWAFTYLSISIFEDYAVGLFIGLPISIGALSTLIYGYRYPSQRSVLRNISFLSLLVYCLGLLVFAWEGLICLIMAAPIGLFFTWLGHLAGYLIIKARWNNTPMAVILLTLSVPALMAFEDQQHEKEEVRAVITSIDIKASPATVWKSVVAFPELEAPTEFIFRTGIAYPINATITGQGVGAIRYCNFSTGSFVEPITVWDEPKLLQFSVEEQPVPMKELSFQNVDPKHLHGYWVSRKGQFKLIPLKDGGTRLEGSTWYYNKINPDWYWTIWSDYIVHQIHNRVLHHIKKQAETH